jgi:hypothetical protein
MPSVTLAALQQATIDRLEENSQLYPLPDLTIAINEAYRQINLMAWLNQATVSVPGFSVAGQLVYQTPTPILIPLVAYFEGKQLGKSSLGSMARTHLSWATDTSIKNGIPREWVPIGINQFVIRPADSIGGRDIEISGVVEPVLLVNPGDVISVNDDFETMIVNLAAHRIQLREGGKVFASSSLLLQSFYHEMKQLCKLQQMRYPRYFVASGVSQ